MNPNNISIRRVTNGWIVTYPTGEQRDPPDQAVYSAKEKDGMLTRLALLVERPFVPGQEDKQLPIC